jgi:hypothetical protein
VTGRPVPRVGRGWLRRAAGVILAATTLTAAFDTAAGPSATAAAVPMGDCTTTSGVVVVVDLVHWGGPVLRSCGSTPTTGFALLNQGGWQTAGTEHDGPGFICRIGYAGYDGGAEFPPPAQQSCVQTPPAGAYWAFWVAGPGQAAWNYSQLGPMSVDPQPGSVELWIFGGTNLSGTAGSAVPTFSPGSVRALNSAPAGGAAADPDPTTAPARAASTSPARPSPQVTSSAGRAAPADTPSAAPAVLAAPPAAELSAHVSHGSPAAALVTLAIVVLLAIGGITAAARRPRRRN